MPSIKKSRNSNQIILDKYINRNIWSGILFGLGLVAFIDETIFHQLLHWHHFYDKSTTEIGLVSDGFFHALSWFATVWGLFILADLRRKNSWQPLRWLGGIFLGAGGFQLYDGTVQHKLMELHQIRYLVEILPYDLVWNITAVIMMITGFILLARARKKRRNNGAELGNADI
jgi:uncharacterized membrane protein